MEFNLNGLKAADHNVKPQSSDKAELILLPTVNKFQISPKAAELLGLASGDNITFIEQDEEASLEGHFFVTKGFGKKLAKLASNTDSAQSPLTFSWAGIYGRILTGDPMSATLTMEALEEKGLLVSRETASYTKKTGVTTGGKKAYSAAYKVAFDLEEAGTVQLDGMEEAQPIYALTNPQKVEYTPRDRKEAEDAEDNIPSDDLQMGETETEA